MRADRGVALPASAAASATPPSPIPALSGIAHPGAAPRLGGRSACRFRRVRPYWASQGGGQPRGQQVHNVLALPRRPANVALLEATGAELRFFSPLADPALPESDAPLLPGGYPRTASGGQCAAPHRDSQSSRAGLADPLRMSGVFFAQKRWVMAQGRPRCEPFCCRGRATMQPRFAALGLQQMALPVGALHGHTFHYSRLDTAPAPVATATNPNDAATERLYRGGLLTPYFYFPSNPAAAAALFGGDGTIARRSSA